MLSLHRVNSVNIVARVSTRKADQTSVLIFYLNKHNAVHLLWVFTKSRRQVLYTFYTPSPLSETSPEKLPSVLKGLTS